MWDFDGYIGKAQEYFRRASQHDHSDDDEFVLWHLLGLEFLLRAPLAAVHPSLLAAAEGDSVLAANGIPIDAEPKTVPSHTVLSRLTKVVGGFTIGSQRDAQTLLNLRNVELHTAEAAIQGVGNEFWLPKLVRIAEVVCGHLGLDVNDVLAPDVVQLGAKLIDAEDKKLAHEVSQRIAGARAFAQKLTEVEMAARVAALEPASVLDRLRVQSRRSKVQCPACATEIYAQREYVRSTRERLEEGLILKENVYVITACDCPVCGLQLTGTAEIVAGGLPQQVTVEEAESLEDMYAEQAVDDEYFNE